MENYKGFRVPNDTDACLSEQVNAFNRDTTCCAGFPCLGRPTVCVECLFSRSVPENKEKRRAAFIDYATEHGYVFNERTGKLDKVNEMPVLKPCMVIVFRSGDVHLMVTPNLGYKLEAVGSHVCLGEDFEPDPIEIQRIYYIVWDRSPRWPDYTTLYDICNGSDAYDEYIVWERPKVKEMTVDEISKALGYAVKVVGNDNR